MVEQWIKDAIILRDKIISERDRLAKEKCYTAYQIRISEQLDQKNKELDIINRKLGI